MRNPGYDSQRVAPGKGAKGTKGEKTGWVRMIPVPVGAARIGAAASTRDPYQGTEVRDFQATTRAGDPSAAPSANGRKAKA
jgi:hypothetical protein